MTKPHVVIRPVDPGAEPSRAALRNYMHEVGQVSGIENIDDQSIVADLDDYRPPTGVFLLASTESLTIGCAGLRTLSPVVGEVKRMWIHPEWRGLGLGRTLLDDVESHALQLGLRRLMLDTNDFLTAAMRLYESAGYEAVSRYNDNPDATSFYAKDLARR